jgi:hypothetical protein
MHQSKNHRLLKIVAIFLTSGLFSFVFATPSTQIWIPSTDIQGSGKLHFGWDAYVSQSGKGLVSNGGLTIGVLPLQKIGLEIGIDYRDISGDHVHPVYVNAKIGTPEGSCCSMMPAFAAGIYDLGFDQGITDYNLAYGLAAKTIPVVGRISLGGYYALGDTSLMLDKDGKSEPSGLLVSWDRTLSEVSDKLWVAVDYQSGTNGYGALSLGAAWKFAPNVGVIFGYDIFNNDAYKPTFTVQFDLDLN